MPNTACTYSTHFRYSNREDKPKYIALKYAPILGGSVLDVGCDRRQLKAFLPAGASYFGADLNDAADVVMNLDRDPLPCNDCTFDTVIAADVLEHLERLHFVFDELCRVSARHVIVSLPNPYRNFVLAAASGTLAKLKHYGLPVDPPRDRHRWFFGAKQAETFLRARAARNGFDVEQLDVEEHGVPAWIDASGRDLFEDWNVRAGTTWAVLRRTNPRADTQT